jgi:flagellar biosynthesis GTPase FlhF
LNHSTTSDTQINHETDESAEDADIDDGLGAFRPSTSFSDLTTLLGPVTEAEANAPTPVVAPVSNPMVVESKPTKKRTLSGSGASTTTAPPAKRKPMSPKAPARRLSGSVRKQISESDKPDATRSSASVVVSGNHATGEKPGTPDPLSMEIKGVLAVPLAPPKPEQKTAVAAPSQVQSAAPTPTQVTSIPKQSAPTHSRCDSEEDFKSIAQVAVSNLVMTLTASAKNPDAAPSSTTDEKVDTSTEHIKALTGNNWVTACTNTAPELPPPPPPSDSSKSNNRARRQNLTPDERARQNRDRNREHARNTRLRKKAYVEELKRTLTELVAQRDAADFEKRQAAQRELEQREVRFRVIEEFLKLRGRNETNFARWAAILEDSFSLSVPMTDYRKAMQSRTSFDQVLRGVSDVMADSSSFAEFLQTLGNGNGAVSFQYHCDRSNFSMDSCTAFLEWTATSVGAVNQVR